MRLHFKIKHLMYLTFWTAVILAIRHPLLAAAPDLVWLIVWLSGITGAGIFVGLYGVALIVEEGHVKDRLVDRMCYLLIGDGILFFLFSVVENNL
jgi:hypothetical protein